MNKKIAIITGTSRGLGKSFAKQLLEEGYFVIGISRSGSDIKHNKYTDLSCDLSSIDSIQNAYEKIKSGVNYANFEEILLINNAGQLSPIAPVSSFEVVIAFQNISTNVAGLIAITSLIAKDIQNISSKKIVLHISSGAAKNPYYGWSAYCSSKAAVEMFNKTFALEQEHEKHPIKTIAFAPGVLDTAMQEQIRNTDEKNFINKQRFVDLKANNELLQTSEVAIKILDFIRSNQSISGGRYDIREL